MEKKNSKKKSDETDPYNLTICGFKSIAHKSTIEIKPLTILAGANSSGKSSFMQPLLLLKQTIETPFDPGPLSLNGPHLRFTSAEQFLSRIASKNCSNELYIEFGSLNRWSYGIRFIKGEEGLVLKDNIYTSGDEKQILTENMSHKEIYEVLPKEMKSFYDSINGVGKEKKKRKSEESDKHNLSVVRDRWSLSVVVLMPGGFYGGDFFSTGYLQRVLKKMIHLPGLRGNPERNYKTTAVDMLFPGSFENYVASIIHNWNKHEINKIEELSINLKKLGLTSIVESKKIDETQVEIKVGRCLYRDQEEMNDVVNIADVGVGVSQVLPVIVALMVAKKGSIVYIEQPEIHLHPRAQVHLAEIIADAAKRGVKVVIETHSHLLLLGIQTLVAEKKLPANIVKLHWFSRNEDGSTKIDSRDLDETGAYGNWPEDFGDIELNLEHRYLNAVED